MLLNKLREFVNIRLMRNVKYSSKSYIEFLKKKGVTIGENVFFNQLEGVTVDITRPSLVSIGNNIRITKGFTLLTHDYSWFVLRNKYQDVCPSSGPVTIGNNVFIGFNVTILPKVKIGNNCIIGSGSVVTKSVPDNSVVAGVPAKVLCNIDEFYQKRKSLAETEAIVYAKSIRNNFGREPQLEDFWEEFPLFLDGDERPIQLEQVIRRQLGPIEEYYTKTHRKSFKSFEEFVARSKF